MNQNVPINEEDDIDLILDIEETKDQLREFIQSAHINLPTSFNEFFECLEQRIEEEKQLHHQISNDQLEIHKLTTSLKNTAQEKANQLVNNNKTIYKAIDFVNSFENDPEAWEPQHLQLKLQQLSNYFNEPLEKSSPFNINKEKIAKITFHFQQELKENIEEIVTNKNTLTLRDEFKQTKTEWEQAVKMNSDRLESKFEDCIKQLESKFSEINRKMIEQAQVIAQLKEKDSNLEDSINQTNNKINVKFSETIKKCNEMTNYVENKINTLLKEDMKTKLDSLLSKLNDSLGDINIRFNKIEEDFESNLTMYKERVGDQVAQEILNFTNKSNKMYEEIDIRIKTIEEANKLKNKLDEIEKKRKEEKAKKYAENLVRKRKEAEDQQRKWEILIMEIRSSLEKEKENINNEILKIWKTTEQKKEMLQKSIDNEKTERSEAIKKAHEKAQERETLLKSNTLKDLNELRLQIKKEADKLSNLTADTKKLQDNIDVEKTERSEAIKKAHEKAQERETLLKSNTLKDLNELRLQIKEAADKLSNLKSDTKKLQDNIDVEKDARAKAIQEIDKKAQERETLLKSNTLKDLNELRQQTKEAADQLSNLKSDTKKLQDNIDVEKDARAKVIQEIDKKAQERETLLKSNTLKDLNELRLQIKEAADKLSNLKADTKKLQDNIDVEKDARTKAIKESHEKAQELEDLLKSNTSKHLNDLETRTKGREDVKIKEAIDVVSKKLEEEIKKLQEGINNENKARTKAIKESYEKARELEEFLKSDALKDLNELRLQVKNIEDVKIKEAIDVVSKRFKLENIRLQEKINNEKNERLNLQSCIKSIQNSKRKRKLKESKILVENNIRWNVADLLKKGNSISKCYEYFNKSHEITNIKNFEVLVNFNELSKLSISEQDQIQLLNKLCDFYPHVQSEASKIIKIYSNKIPNLLSLMFETIPRFKDLTEAYFNFSNSDGQTDFGKNEINDSQVELLSKSLAVIKTITQLSLDLSYNNITTNGLAYLNKTLKEMKNIKKLKLQVGEGKNKIDDHGIKGLSTAVEEMHNLNALILKFCYGKHSISNNGIEYLAVAIKNQKNLTVLKLNFRGGNNKITDEGIEVLSSSLIELKSITTLQLNLSTNLISEKGIQALSNALLELKKMTSLQLLFSKTKQTIEEKGFEKLPIAIKEMKSLKSLYLDFSFGEKPASDKKIQYIMTGVKELKNIVKLDMDFNTSQNGRITDNGAESIVIALKDMPSIKELGLYLKGNQMTDRGIEKLISCFKACKKIKCFNINFSSNKLTKNGISKIEQFKAENKQLQIELNV